MKINKLTKLFLSFFAVLTLAFPSRAGVIPVTSVTDNVAGSFRFAVSAAASGDTITFSNLIDGTPVVIAALAVEIDKSITIMGNDTTNTILSGASLNSILRISGGADVMISGLSFRGGLSAASGGAIEVESGNLNLIACSFTGNQAAVSGGAISINDGNLNIENCAFSNNLALGAMATNGGGAIVNLGANVDISETDFHLNTATGAAGSGGAILNLNGGELTISGGNFTENTSVRAGGAIEDNSGEFGGVTISGTNMTGNSTGASPGNGGAIHITGEGNISISGGMYADNTASAEGGALWNGTGTMMLNGVSIENNTAAGADADQGGGGVFNAGGTLTITNSTSITNNQATGTSGSGGGILTDVGGSMTIENSTISFNTANRAGGGIEDVSGSANLSSITNVRFEGNSSGSNPGNGGAIHITGNGNMEISGGTVLNNTASLEGGGLWNGTGTMTIINVSINGNTASGDDASNGGGGVFNAGGTVNIMAGTVIDANIADGASGSGGAIFNDVGGTLNIDGVEITNNNCNRAGGGIEDASGAATVVTLTNTTLFRNTTGSAPGNGGGLHVSGDGEIQISNSVVSENMAAAEGGGLWNGAGLMVVDSVMIMANTASGNAADQGGGGIYNLSGTLQITGSTQIVLNQATGTSGSGGGILNDVGATLSVENTLFRANTSIRAGGAIEDVSGSETITSITSVTFESNTSGTNPGNGGAIHITGDGTMNITSSIATMNSAGAEGGAYWNGTGTMTINGGRISNNTASGNDPNQGGGGLFNAGGTLIVNGMTEIRDNVADGTSGSGGGILNDAGGILTLNNVMIAGNSAVRAGGGIEDVSGDVSIVNINDVTFESNSASANPGSGGAIHISGNGDMNITGGSANSNTAAAEGGAFWNGTGVMTVSGVTISENIASGDAADQGGGGLFNAGGTLIVNNSTEIKSNMANGTSGSGGGILNDVGGTLTLENIFIEGNSANRAGGGIEDVSGIATVVTLNEVSLTANNAGTNPGNGGAVHISGDGNIEINGGIVADNMAIEGGGLWNNVGSMMVSDVYFEANLANGNDADQGGGAIYNNGGALSVDSESYFTANKAAGVSGSGGAIFNNTGGTVDVRNTTFVSNESNRAGGAIEDASGVVMAFQIDSCLFELNDAGDNPGNGGAIHMTGMGDITVSNSYFDSNIAAGTGGALWNGSGVMTIEATGIIDNVAGTGAGGVYNTTGEVNILNSTIARNMVSTVSGIGGGIQNLPDGTVTVMSSTISENISFRAGGAIYNEGMLEIINSTLYNNQSDTLSGGVVQIGGSASINMTGSILAGNTSASGYGDADLEGMVMGGGYNLIGADHLNLFNSDTSNITGTLTSPIDPMLDTLAQNGGFTRTHAIICGSPAYNAGDPNDNSPDQRGMAVFGMRRDIGSFEYQDTCATIATTEPSNRIEIENIFPNPVRSEMSIDLGIQANNEAFDWTIVELSSGTIKMAGQTRSNRLTLNVSNLASGSYAIEFRNSDKIGIKRFVIIE
jgi:hypothetical protein